LSTDVGPVIDEEARAGIAAHIETARAEGRLLHELRTPNSGTFIAPTLIKVGSIADMGREIFGPVLHLATFKSSEIDTVVDTINATGYGLTFGLQTRIDDRVQHICERIHAGNIYVNRNQIGAIVGSQPFGGEGLSGTGPKAGGPNYLPRFVAPSAQAAHGAWNSNMTAPDMQAAIAAAPSAEVAQTLVMPGPTGESNKLTLEPRAPLLCLGPSAETAEAQASLVRAMGGIAVKATGSLPAVALETLTGFSGALFWGASTEARAYEQALAKRTGAILPLITATPDLARVMGERHVCVDTTASGGNAALLAGQG